MRQISSRTLVRTTVGTLVLVVTGWYTLAIGQDAEPAATAKAPAAQAKKFRGRLPAYYRHVVDDKQRAAVYKIQKDYSERLEALKAQLEALVKERNDKIAAVLTPEQVKKVQQLNAEAIDKRKKRAAAEKPAEPAATR